METQEPAPFADPAGSGAPVYVPPPARRRRTGGLLAGLALTFVAGVVAAGWAARESEFIAGYLVPRAEPVERIVRVPVPVSTPSVPTAATPTDPMLSQQVDAIDEKVSQIEQRTLDAAGNADRAEGLLIAFAARRAIERGMALGYLEGLLRQHFAASQPQAVAAVISAARQPVTLADLRSGLDARRTALVAGGPATSAWTSFKREMAGLIVIRRADGPSAVPGDRFDRATQALETGQVDVALAEVSRLPGRAAAADWIAKARRYLAARTALDRLEAAALVEQPRPPTPVE